MSEGRFTVIGLWLLKHEINLIKKCPQAAVTNSKGFHVWVSPSEQLQCRTEGIRCLSCKAPTWATHYPAEESATFTGGNCLKITCEAKHIQCLKVYLNLSWTTVTNYQTEWLCTCFNVSISSSNFQSERFYKLTQDFLPLPLIALTSLKTQIISVFSF